MASPHPHNSERHPPLENWVNLIYDELRERASRSLRNERQGHSFQTTDLVHEVYLRMAQLTEIDWENREQVLRAAVGSMRRVLIDRARYNASAKRDYRRRSQAAVDQVMESTHSRSFQKLLELDQAIDRLKSVDPVLFELVQLKIFGGLELHAIADNLNVSVSTVKRRWSLAKAWLYRELYPEDQPSGDSDTEKNPEE